MTNAVKLMTVVGARPQFIKAAAVSAVLSKEPRINEIIVHTGQHFDTDMSDIFFEQLGIPTPAHTLGIAGGSHGAQTGAMLAALEKVMLEERPGRVLIYGDTNSTLAAALSAAKLHIPIAHVEAGLRSFNRRMPEEINRIVADHLSDILFAPTKSAADQLSREGIEKGVHMVGDVMYDVARSVKASLSADRTVGTMSLPSTPFVLATIHRAENTDDPARLRAIFTALAQLAKDVQVITPLHPRTRKALDSLGSLEAVEKQMTIIGPVGYAEMLALEAAAELIVTDSGGVQKEAYFQRVPCVTLRDETEWVELVETGWNRLCKPENAQNIVATCRGAIGSRGSDVELYGNGNAASLITDILAAA